MNRLLLIFFLFSFQSAHSQRLLKNAEATIGTSALISSGKTNPFWLRSNQYGEIPFNSGEVQISADLRNEYDSLFFINGSLKKFDWAYAFRTVSSLGRTNELVLSEAHIKARYGPFEAFIGRKKVFGLVDTLLSSGSFAWSGNALPIPKIDVAIPNFLPLGKNKLLAIKGNYAHGWFGSTDSVKNYFLHQKSFYLRIGKPQWKFKFYGGVQHLVQWGGSPTKPFYDRISDQIITKFGNNFATYMEVVSGVSLSNKNGDWTNQPGIPANEAGNRSGNHLGTIDIGITFDANFGKFQIYKQSYFEDGSLFYLSSVGDGLYGISFKRNESILKGINIEYIQTDQQGGDLGSGSTIPELRGNDNYFNNGIYKDGWSYRQISMGTPFMAQAYQYAELSSMKNQSFFFYNRLRGVSLGSSMLFSNKLEGLFRYALINNIGNFSTPMSKIQHAILIQTRYLLSKDSTINLGFGGDFGGLLSNQVGLNASYIRKINL